uniref:Uncharacterized protein n=1 Tax=Sipha flava TaxID=143950 RepID=A0A2S2QUT5_9HEMI
MKPDRAGPYHLEQWWPNYGPRANSGPPSFNIWPAKVFYITALICIPIIFCIYVKKNLECIFLWPAIKKKLFFMARGKKSLATTGVEDKISATYYKRFIIKIFIQQ